MFEKATGQSFCDQLSIYFDKHLTNARFISALTVHYYLKLEALRERKPQPNSNSPPKDNLFSHLMNRCVET